MILPIWRAEGIAGHNYAPGDAASLAETIARALEDQATLNIMAQQNLHAADHTPFADVIEFHMAQIPQNKK